jgi:TonB family protein
MKTSYSFFVLWFAVSTVRLFAQADYKVVDAFPTNVGGKDEFKRIFEQELVYPEKALKDKNQHQVTINFSIAKDSSVSDVKLTSCGDKSIDDEALRLFKLYQWEPAKRQGRHVATNWSVTFTFDPKKYNKICKERGFRTITYLPNEKIDSSGIIYTNPDELPGYQKGMFALQDFIKENLEYSRQAQLSNIQGTVVLRFVVEPSGLVTNIAINRRIGGGCDEEAIRVLQLIKWYPGKKDGKLVRVQTTFPFNFILNNEFKDNSAGEQK